MGVYTFLYDVNLLYASKNKNEENEKIAHNYRVRVDRSCDYVHT